MARRTWGVGMPPETGSLLNVGEVAARLGISNRSVYNRMADGSLRFVKIGGLTRFEPGEVERFIAAQRGDDDGQ
jgi:excisionase family DNA binding protein